jgi:hypothetical protein
MNIEQVKSKFSLLGARLKVNQSASRLAASPPMTIDVQSDRKGEFFEIQIHPRFAPQIEVLDLQPKDRHLLLLPRNLSSRRVELSRFICGHDERHWFVAAAPGRSTVMEDK